MKHNSHHRHPFRYPLRLVIALAGAMLLVGCAGEGVTPLMQAAHTGNTTELKRQIATAPDINKQSSYGWTALMFASWQGHPNAVEMLLEAGADPNNISGQIPSQFDTVLGHPASTALQEALRERHMQIAQMLLDHGANVDPMAVALTGRAGDMTFMAQILDRGADLNRPSNNAFYPSALCCAAANGDLNALEWLLQQGADPNLLARGQTALKEAIERDQLAAVQFLLEHGADPNLVYDTTRVSPLFTATTGHVTEQGYAANLAIIRLLLAHGADRNRKVFHGDDTALDFVKSQRKHTLLEITPEITPEVRKLFEDAIAHKDAVIKLLEEEAK